MSGMIPSARVGSCRSNGALWSLHSWLHEGIVSNRRWSDRNLAPNGVVVKPERVMEVSPKYP